MNDVTRILSAIEQGDPQAAEQLLPLVYDELRTLAAQKLAHEKPGQTLQATALVHEAYLRLVDAEQAAALGQPGPLLRRRGRGHAADPRRGRPPQGQPASGRASGGGANSWTGIWSTCPVSDELLDLDEALSKLGAVDAQAAEVVKLRVFAGMTVEEVAEHLGISPRTAKRSWAYARAWLGRELSVHPGPEP